MIDLNTLNEKQREAVVAPPGHLLVIAGAGSGKTSVLVKRIAWLIHNEHVSPHAIFAVTFTNKAAGEMRHRIESILNRPVGDLWIGTFHSLSHRLLRMHYRDANLPENFQILDSDDQQRLIKRTIKSLGLEEEHWPARQAQWFINKQKDECIKPKEINPNRDAFLKTMKEIYEAYEVACERGGLIDFAELLFRAYLLLLNNETIRIHYQNRFKHILVDEFQDTNHIQYDLIKLLTTDSNYVMAVGDDNQSIYGWRGAQIENIYRFEREFPGTQLIYLEQNYRSTETILNAANHLISHNDSRYEKSLWTDRKTGDLISVYAAFNDLDEAKFIVSQIKQCLNEGHSYRDMAILYRSNAQSRVLEEMLLYEGLPYRVYGGLRFFERAEIKDGLAYLRLIANRQDDAAFERVINLPTRGIGDKTLETLRQIARENNISLWESSIQAIKKGSFTARANNALVSFMELIDHIALETKNNALAQQCDHALKASGLWHHYTRIKSDKTQAKLENLEELVNASKLFEADPDNTSSALSQFLNYTALESGETQADQYSDSVQLMTLHSAKGLEFSIVFIAGIEEGLFPHKMSHDEPGRLEEERRLCYVGMTRAMQKLFLTYAEVRRQYGKDHYHKPSRFINEIPKKYLHYIRNQKTTEAFSSKKSKQHFLKNTEITDTGLRLGAAVLHPKFGEGLITNFEGSGQHARIQVQFKSHGTKWLVMSHANLQAV